MDSVRQKMAVVVEVRLYKTIRKKRGISNKCKAKAGKAGEGRGGELNQVILSLVVFYEDHFKVLSEFVLVYIRIHIE